MITPTLNIIPVGQRTRSQNITFSVVEAQSTTTGAADAVILIDTSANFTGTNFGDLVINETDGSYGLVRTVTSTTRLEVHSLSGGSDNTFETGDTYTIVTGPQPIYQENPGGELFLAVTDAAADGLMLVTGKQEDIFAGIPLRHDLTGTSSFDAYLRVRPDSLLFDNQERRRSAGHDGANNRLTIDDDTIDFHRGGAKLGDVVWNVTDGSWSRVNGITAHQLTCFPTYPTGAQSFGGWWQGGSDNNVDTGDRWRVDRSPVWLSPALIAGAAGAGLPCTVSVTEY